MDHMDQGNTFLKRRYKKTLAQDLSDAKQDFLKARDILLDLPGIDSNVSARVYLKLLHIEIDMSYNRKLSLEQTGSHL